jgi:4-amino-4-deoxy-L-arabinose transferase-like glycosyltransferase
MRLSTTLLRPAALSQIAGSFWFWAGLIVFARVAALLFADGDLGPDEAQYWFWAQSPDFGYFSKPPMVAWIIAATTALFGDAEWAVRLAAPLLHGGSAVLIYLTAALLFDRRVAAFSGLGWLLLPGASVSSFLITTDAALLFFWSGALYFFFRIAARPDSPIRDFAALGAMIGLGLMSKYAMLYFVAAFATCLLISSDVRRAYLKPPLLLSAAVAALLFAPNLAWNAANEFQTVSHTAANANWSADMFQAQSPPRLRI